MAIAGLEIKRLQPGASIQDRGRAGFRRFGVTKGGVMDQFALAEGQALLGNGADCAALEMAGRGGEFRSVGRNVIACTGAEMKLSVNGREAAWRQTMALRDGDMLEIGACAEGSYGYLHLPGGIDGPVVLGSRSAHAHAELGWTPKPGERLVPLADRWPKEGLRLPRPAYFTDRIIRIMEGPQSKLFAEQDFRSLRQAEFRVTNARNRVGMRIESSMGPISADLGTVIASDAIVAGDIQIAADGIAAVLLADFQPVGGYPRIATVITADLHKLAQMPVGTAFRMRMADRRQALKELADLRSLIAGLPGRIESAVRDPKDMADLLAYSLIDGVISGDEQDED